MTNHTPGPWTVADKPFTSSGIQIFGPHPKWPHALAIVKPACGPNLIDNVGPANACLIAAAPDMLDALHDTARGIAELFTEKGQARRYAAAQALHVKRIRGILAAAIAKAEGRT